MSAPSHSPLISELPRMLDASDWLWKSFESEEQNLSRSDWLIGMDSRGHQWLLKMTGSFCSYREHVFSSLAQRLGISCQSSAYVIVQPDTLPLRDSYKHLDRCQLAISLIEEHFEEPCSPACVMKEVIGKSMSFDDIDRLSAKGVSHFKDWVCGDALGHLCGQFEPHDHLFTKDHQYVVIDNELMFAGSPCLEECSWWEEENARPLIAALCRKFVELSDDELRAMATIPEGYSVLGGRDLYGDLQQAQQSAMAF